MSKNRPSPEAKYAEQIANAYGVDLAVIGGTWGGARIIWADEARQYRKQEAICCQTIDANCNDCKHLKRLPLRPSTVYESVQREWGSCSAGNRQGEFQLWAGIAEGRNCFEHRNGVEPPEGFDWPHNFA